MPGGEKKSLRVIIAGGGTGGHLFPGIAIAEEFMIKDPTNQVLFINTGKPFETSILKKFGLNQKRITAAGMKGQNLKKKAASFLKVPKGLVESIRILKKFKPDVVLGIGSYSAGVVVLAGWLMGAKIALHEQNILPGMTNRLLSPLAHRIYVSFEKTKLWLIGKQIKVTGNPVRKKILNCEKRVNKNKDPFTVLIVGGSQGAHSINVAVMEAIEKLDDKDSIFFIHQTGTADQAVVKTRYQASGILAKVQAFFDDMAQPYKDANLVICRAGATTVAEITALGKPALFIPYPFAADNHQVLNARMLESKGAAEMILQENLNGRSLSEKIEFYLQHPDILKRMGKRAKAFGKPNAAADIVADCYHLVLG